MSDELRKMSDEAIAKLRASAWTVRHEAEEYAAIVRVCDELLDRRARGRKAEEELAELREMWKQYQQEPYWQDAMEKRFEDACDRILGGEKKEG